MAPPPPATLPLQQRLIALAQTLQFAWFVGHLTLLFCSIRYGMSFFTFHSTSRWARFSYRTAFLAAAVTYGIVVFKAQRARARSGTRQGSPLALLADENVQYLIMALVWLFSKQTSPAILPYTVYSIFHVATYTRTNLIPTIQPPAIQQTPASPTPTSPNAKPAAHASPLADAIGKFVKQYYDPSMTIVAMLEIFLLLHLFVKALFFVKGSWIMLALYTVFFRARFAQSTFVQSAVHQLTARVDAAVSNQSTPPAVRQAWDTVKGLVAQGADATDPGRYAQGAGAGPKKAQ